MRDNVTTVRCRRQWIYVAADQWRHGVASRLLELLATWFLDQATHRICVAVDDDAARPFYHRHGAVEMNRHWMVWSDIAVVLDVSRGRSAARGERRRRSTGTFRDTPLGTHMNWREHISVDPDICHGQACFRGTRIMVSVVLDNLAAGASAAELRTSYPGLPADAVPAALAYAADLASERVIAFPA